MGNFHYWLLRLYSCNKVTKTWIQTSCQNWLGSFSLILAYQKTSDIFKFWQKMFRCSFVSFLFYYYCMYWFLKFSKKHNFPPLLLKIAKMFSSVSYRPFLVNWYWAYVSLEYTKKILCFDSFWWWKQIDFVHPS